MASGLHVTVLTDVEPVPHAIAVRAARGETRSGDRAVLVAGDGGTVVAAIDGLGHGPDAADAADAAAATLEEPGTDAVDDLLRRCHERLRRTRGAAISLARLDPAGTTMEWVGVGNVDACLLKAATARCTRLVTTSGVVGSRIPHVRPASVEISAGDLLLLHTDGVDRDVVDDLRAVGDRRAPLEDLAGFAKELLLRHASGDDDALVVLARPAVAVAAGNRP